MLDFKAEIYNPHNPFTPKSDLIDFTLSNASDFTRQRVTPWE